VAGSSSRKEVVNVSARLAALSAILAVLAPAGVATNDLKFHSREYKLMLEPGKI
jgi:hypothetical protein